MGGVCERDADCCDVKKCNSSKRCVAGGSCFSERTTIEVDGKGVIPMKHLKINDWVRIGGDSYSRVHSFGHYQPNAWTVYLQIQVASDEKTKEHHPLEITADHLMFIYDLAKMQQQAVPAGRLKVGDWIVSAEDTTPTQVSSITKVSRRGAYAPMTTTGGIAVGGILASNYVSRGWLHDRVSSQVLQWLQHGAAVPYRMYCSVSGCENETYDEETGFSPWVLFWYRLEQWQLGLNPILQALFLLVLAVPSTLVVVTGILLTTSV